MTLNFLNIIHVLLAVALIGFILVQRGPGATAGSAFGSGASSTVFGAKGSGSFLTKTTAILATLFFALSMLMAVQANREAKQMMKSGSDLGVVGSLQDNTEVPAITPSVPANDDGEVPAMGEKAATQAQDNAKAMQEDLQSAAKGAALKAEKAAQKQIGDAQKQAQDAVEGVKDQAEKAAADSKQTGDE